jgi:hypothetical protein
VRRDIEHLRLETDGLLECLVAAHSVSKVNGINVGHPVDVRMFESTKWVRAFLPSLTPPLGLIETPPLG